MKMLDVSKVSTKFHSKRIFSFLRFAIALGLFYWNFRCFSVFSLQFMLYYPDEQPKQIVKKTNAFIKTPSLVFSV